MKRHLYEEGKSREEKSKNEISRTCNDGTIRTVPLKMPIWCLGRAKNKSVDLSATFEIQAQSFMKEAYCLSVVKVAEDRPPITGSLSSRHL